MSPRTRVECRVCFAALAALAVSLCLAAAPRPVAAQEHYRDVFPGDRAAGMGGAYTALADDATGAYYNPAGLAAIQHADVSLSANALRFTEQTYHDLIFGKNLTAESVRFFPTSFGAIKPLGPFRVGLSIVETDQLSLRVKEDFQNILVQGVVPANVRIDLQRTSETYLAGPTIAYPITPALSVGATVYFIYGQFTLNDFTLREIIQPDGSTIVDVATFTSAEGTRTGFIGHVGMLWKPNDRFHVGLTVRSKSDILNRWKTRDTLFSATPSGNLQIDAGHGEEDRVKHTEDYPWSGTLGIAVKPLDRLTLAMDIDYHRHSSYPIDGVQVYRQAVVDYSVGAEAYVTEKTPLWLGFFTNFSNFQDPHAGNPNRPEKVDFMGFTVGGAFVGEHSELALGMRYGFGDGKGNRVEDAALIDVTATEISIFLASRYKF